MIWISFLHIMFNIFWFTIAYDKLVDELKHDLFWLLLYVIYVMTSVAFVVIMLGGI